MGHLFIKKNRQIFKVTDSVSRNSWSPPFGNINLAHLDFIVHIFSSIQGFEAAEGLPHFCYKATPKSTWHIVWVLSREKFVGITVGFLALSSLFSLRSAWFGFLHCSPGPHANSPCPLRLKTEDWSSTLKSGFWILFHQTENLLPHALHLPLQAANVVLSGVAHSGFYYIYLFFVDRLYCQSLSRKVIQSRLKYTCGVFLRFLAVILQ